MVYENLKVEINAGVALLTLARPAKLNAFTAGMHADLRDALDKVEGDDAVRIVVITGEGRAFSAGQDLTEDLPRHADGRIDLSGPLERDYNPLVTRLMDFPKITIAAINGPAVGASLNIALACDVVFAAKSAYLQEAFSKIALVPDAGGTYILPRLVGARRALALSLFADQISAEEAQRMGLVYRVFEDTVFSAEVLQQAAKLAAGPRHALMLTKKAIRASLGNDLKAQLALEAEMQQAAADHPDFAEGVTAFKQKRAPVYK